VDVPEGGDGVSVVSITDPDDALRSRYLGDQHGAVYLIRPDQHVVARWPAFDSDEIAAAMNNALAKE